MKVYDYQWFTTFGLDEATAAGMLADDGVDTVLLQNRIDPLPNSGVDQEAYLSGAGGRMARYDDRAWSDALRAAGLRVVQTTATFFDPALLQTFPDARPVDAAGVPHRGFDWYLGVCPTHGGYLEAKTERLRRVVADLAPDGMFLSFTRFPGFWENWVPDYAFGDADRSCFCDRCRARFAAERSIDVPPGDAAAQARFILREHGAAWTGWRCAVLAGVVAGIADELRATRPGLEIVLNTLAFPASDFGGLDARREIAAQDLGLLSATVDTFEVMTYLQILNRPEAWMAPVVADAKGRVGERAVVCTLQVAPLYSDGIHAGRGRPGDVTAGDLDRSARAALDAGADGLVFYHWTDFLLDEAEGGRKRAVLRGLSRG